MRKLGNLLAAAGLALVSTATIASAQNTVEIGVFVNASMPTLECANGTLISGTANKLVPWNKTETTNVTVPAGLLNVEMYWSWDAYDSRVTVTQPNERWRVRVGSNVSEWTTDVPDFTVAGLVTDSMESFRTDGGLVSYEHWSVDGDETSPNSVQPLGVCVTVTPDVVTTVATTISSTVVATTVVDTTIPTPSTSVPPEATTIPTTIVTTTSTTAPTTVSTTITPTTVATTQVITTVLVHETTPNPDPTPTTQAVTTVTPVRSVETSSNVVSKIPDTVAPSIDTVKELQVRVVEETASITVPTTELAYTGTTLTLLMYGLAITALGFTLLVAGRRK